MSITGIDRTRDQLEAADQELAALTYSISHDLRAPLRAITGFSDALAEDYGNSLDSVARDYLDRVRSAAAQMELSIEGLAELARVSRAELRPSRLDLTAMAEAIAQDFRLSDPGRQVRFLVAKGLSVTGDPALIQVCMRHLLGNAWKFTSAHPSAVVEVARDKDGVIYVRDDGAGFDPAFATQLFGPLQRLHNQTQFPGVGVGLAIVRRIINRHGGRVWATAEPEQGATIYIDLQ
jgi:light-regulated signal transduction histidine kinase (bacteriophytochrome)